MSGDADSTKFSGDEDSDESDSSGAQGVPTNINEETDLDEISEFELDFQQYKIAGAEARYRDQMLFTTFYLSLVALAVLLQVVIGLYRNGQILFVMVVSAIAATGFGNLLWWSYSTKQARNRAYGFRSKIEEKFGDDDDEQGLRLNSRIGSGDKFDFIKNRYRNSDFILGNSSSDLVIAFAVITTAGWIVITGGTVAILLSDNASENTLGLFIAGGALVFYAVLVVFILLNEALRPISDESENDGGSDSDDDSKSSMDQDYGHE
jgi:hypothetical protein